MKALVYSAVKTLTLSEIAAPEVGIDSMLVRIRATGICGSDVHGFLGHQARRQPGLVLGHETVGIVERVGDRVDPTIVGKRVSINPLITCGVCEACRSGKQNRCVTWQLLGLDKTQGGFAEFVSVPSRNVHAIPDSVSDASAVMVEPLANAFHLISLVPANGRQLPSAVIIGAGTLGVCILSVAQKRGINVIAVSDTNEKRLAVCTKLGAKKVINPAKEDLTATVKELTDGKGVPIVFDAVGRAATRNAATQLLEKGGSAMLLGLDERPTTFDFQDLVRREIALIGSFAYTERDFAEALQFVINNEVDLSPWTEVRPMTTGQESFDQLVADPGDRIKIALVP